MEHHVKTTRATQVELMEHSSYDQQRQWQKENTQAPGALTHHREHPIHASTFHAAYEPGRQENVENAAEQQRGKQEAFSVQAVLPLALVAVVLVYVYRS